MSSFKEVPGPDEIFESESEDSLQESLDSAKDENAAFARGDYDAWAKKHSYRRDQNFRENIHQLIIFFIWFVASVIVLAATFWSWHLLMPKSLHFLGPAQIDKIQTSFLSSVVSAVMALLARQKYFDD